MAEVLAAPRHARRNSLSIRDTPKFTSSPTIPQEQSPATTTSSHSSVVPAYPYNVSMLPVPTANGAAPDDSGITTRLPSICVDYLSHDWAEDDVWTSWKAMTRHKSEIANGVRLENASWRTWAKQRGKLKTISPETLNWLKDSDVTWLYGPLHTAVEAVPPPKIAGTADRLGLEPLRSLSDSKKLRKPVVVTKPILKYRSLSDILMPAATPSSPVLEATFLELDEAGLSIPYAKSDSNLARLNREANRHRTASPHPGLTTSDSSEITSDSSSSRNGERRHISFNHRVEQCIAVDSTDEAKKYSSTESSESEDEEEQDDGDDEDDVLTFKSSPRVATFGPAALLPRQHHRSEKEPHTIARLGPTTLKSVEIWPAPSPAIYYQDSIPEIKLVGDVVDGAYGAPTATYTARPEAQARRALYDYVIPTGDASQWDDDEDYAMGFDYFNNGPEIGIADEYDMAQYGSTHLVSGVHNNFAGDESYLVHGPYSPTYAPGGLESPSLHSNNSTPARSRQSSVQDGVPVSPVAVRGPHAPPPSSKEANSPKRSILKNRSRQSSDSSSLGGEELPPAIGGARFGGSNSPLMIVTPDDSTSSSPSTPSTSSPQISPRSSASSLAAVMASAGIPSTIHLRETSTGIRRVDSNEVVREARGRSTSRGSSSSLERSASADRRTGASISPSSSYSPPVFVPPTVARAIGLPGSRSRTNSTDSLNSLGVTLAGGRELMPDVPEASSESEAETVKESGVPVVEGIVISVEEVDDEAISIQAIPLVVDGSITETIGEARASNSPSRGVVPLVNSPSIGNAPRQPSPGAPTTSVDDEGYTSEAAVNGTPEPEELSSIQSGSEEANTPSNARRSLLRASRAGAPADREGSIGRSSIESSSHDDSYGFGYYDEDSDAGIVSRTLEVAGTVRDLIGALGRGFFSSSSSSSRKESNPPSGTVTRPSK